MAWKPYQDPRLNLGHATAPSITASINELLITGLIPDQSDVVQKNIGNYLFLIDSGTGYVFFCFDITRYKLDVYI